MKKTFLQILILNMLFLYPYFASAQSVPHIDVTGSVAPPTGSPYEPGSASNPQGLKLTADSRSFFLNDKPWIPIVGEFHYARYTPGEWRDELLKMKAGGINTVSTYVFWIHHEEERGRFDWSGPRNLRAFLQLCREVGLKAIVRMGPWCHGEVRNGGFPDWVQKSGTRLRSNDPAFLQLVEPFFREQAQQMAGLLWKDGGPVIAIQLDNECAQGDYLLTLKAMARADGIDVPLYTITGWQGGIPKAGLLPLFGGYTDGFWGGRVEDYRKEFIFTEVRAVNDLGAQMITTNPSNSQLIAQFPYACVEIGGGMMSAYGRRILINPDNIAALTLAKLGSGNNMPGYYMYHGGTNPAGKLSFLHEDHPNQLPVKDYDFQAPLGANGQVRPQYHLLRQQHLFLADFGAELARMPVYFPEKRPTSLTDFATLRWNMRSNGRSGFLFFSNQQPYEPLPAHANVQFAVKTADGDQLVPSRPITIPTGSYGFWPVNLNCSGVMLKYATAQLICSVPEQNGTMVYFFTALPGITPELAFRTGAHTFAVHSGDRKLTADGLLVQQIKPGMASVVDVASKGKVGVRFVVLTAGQGRQLYRASFAGRERVIISPATAFADGRDLRLQAEKPAASSVSIFPALAHVKLLGKELTGHPSGLFSRFDLPAHSDTEMAEIRLEKPANPLARSLKGTEEATWNEAAVYRLTVPPKTAGRRLVLNFNYIGDAARLYVGNEFFNDNYYNGNPFSIALWRIPHEKWPDIQLKVLPWSQQLNERLPAIARAKAQAAKASGSIDNVVVTVSKSAEVRIQP